MYKVIGAVTDNGEFFEIQPKFAKNIITGYKAIGVNPNCKNQEVAVKLAAFLGSEDAQLAHFKLRAQEIGRASCRERV